MCPRATILPFLSSLFLKFSPTLCVTHHVTVKDKKTLNDNTSKKQNPEKRNKEHFIRLPFLFPVFLFSFPTSSDLDNFRLQMLLEFLAVSQKGVALYYTLSFQTDKSQVVDASPPDYYVLLFLLHASRELFENRNETTCVVKDSPPTEKNEYIEAFSWFIKSHSRGGTPLSVWSFCAIEDLQKISFR